MSDTVRLYRVVGLEEYNDLKAFGRFRRGWNSLEGKWFADTLDGVLKHAGYHYPDGRCRIVAVDVPNEVIARSKRWQDLDHFGPATFLESIELDALPPILELDHGN